ncbi:MAG TPA: IS3 family transposase [Gammaproteobacteria bacterium]|nr:IS3 family transposase [Gammaproteobacteria bacterium]
MNTVIEQRPERLPMSAACQTLGLNRSSVYARRKRLNNETPPKRSRKASIQPRALSEQERQCIIATLHSESYRDQPPAEVYQRLLENDQYLCSISTMHRLLRQISENGERRPQRPAQHHAIPRLLAYSPNEVWTWDITKLPLIRRGVYLSLYVVLDLYSRFVVAWMLSTKENSALAKQLMNEATARYGITEGQLTLHQDRGSPMTAHGYLENMKELDITCSHSRPRVSNDNPFSESQFKTQKYQPDYPGRFNSVTHARQWCEDYFDWYNFKHHHSGLAGFTPEQVFTGSYREVAQQKQQALDVRFEKNPERFVKGRPIVKLPPAFVAINPVTPEEAAESAVSDCVNFPTLTAAGYVASNRC